MHEATGNDTTLNKNICLIMCAFVICSLREYVLRLCACVCGLCVDTSFASFMRLTGSALHVFCVQYFLFSFISFFFGFVFVFGGTGESFRWFISGFSFGLIKRKQIIATYGIVFRLCTNGLTHKGL